MNEAPPITVRQATLADKDAIFTFIRQAYAGRWQFKIPERWEWEFQHNPYWTGPHLPIWIAVDQVGKVVGQTGALIEPLQVGEKVIPIGWSVDTFLLAAYRGQGIGYELQKANDEAHPIFMSLSMSAANRRIKAALGSVPAGEAATLIRTIRHSPSGVTQNLTRRLLGRRKQGGQTFARLLQALRLDQALAASLNARRQRRDSRLRTQIPPDLGITPIVSFDDEIDLLWEAVSPHYPAAIRRDRQFLNWKYVQQPHAAYERFIARREGSVCGYLIVRKARPPEPNVGIIADLLAVPQDRAAITALLAFGIEHLASQGVESIKAATTSSSLESHYLALGFRKSASSTPMVHCKLEGTTCEAILQPGGLLLSRGDHDWDQVPLA